MTNILHGIIIRTIDVRRYRNAVLLFIALDRTTDLYLIFTLERTHNNTRAV